ncbi:MAG: hypothetical protein IJZ64_02740 [Ruminococcus sp.]|nr:hypothetical protein [Ruminococcus sp.]
MADSSLFCTCTNKKCPLHPANHNKGCTPCISKNLHLKELPNCFFNKISGAEHRNGDTFKDFAEIVLKKLNNK